MSVELVLLAGLVVAIGALVQGCVGYGMALVAAPLLTLLDPAFVPVPMLMLAIVHSVLTVARELGDADWRGVGWAMVGRVPGTALGVAAVSLLPQRGFSMVVGLAVLGCVLLSVVSWRRPCGTPAPGLRPTAKALVTAGVASGMTGTAAAIGGPPIALLYQSSAGSEVRATLGAYFAIGTVVSLAGLAMVGEVTTQAAVHGLVLTPFLGLGFALSGPARRVLDRGRTRTAVLTVAGTSAALLIGRALIG